MGFLRITKKTLKIFKRGYKILMNSNAKILAKLLPNGFLTLRDLYNYYGGEVALDRALAKLNPGYIALGFPAFWVKKDKNKLYIKTYGTNINIPQDYTGLIYKSDLTKIKVLNAQKIESNLEDVSIENPISEGGIVVISLLQEVWELDFSEIKKYNSFKEAFLAEGIDSKPMFLSYKLFEILFKSLYGQEISISPMAKEIVDSYGELFKVWCEKNSSVKSKAA